MTKKVLFLINPVSGIGKQKTVERSIETDLDHDNLSVDISYTRYKGHARELAGQAVGRYHAVVAVGGDGTVNEVASKLVGSDTALAIVPAGSGNGLARYMEIPMRMNKAVQCLNSFLEKRIDTMKVNQYCSVNVAGIGFDAHISHNFEGKRLRGPLGYLQLITSEFASYKSESYQLKIDGKTYNRKAFLVSFANSSQYGNNIHIAPNALINDGFIDVCIIPDFAKINAPAMVLSLLDKSLNKNDKDEVVRAKLIEIEHPTELKAHIDGEPVSLGNKATIQIQPLSLKIIVPPKTLIENSILDPLKEIIPNMAESLGFDAKWKTKLSEYFSGLYNP
ncbi:lipid kinase, YegS/Rv2252/BmrU family [Saccharicrinis carchari]|uniref:Lipid kinase, YegS/Rv2252/BmrU family n=1 Tax=Saccharicrinis carchari TaxID=1168039 RepID=A0A521AP21_SACCC|nr:diacylglycerol kinase family protein [Saccharicrinis carchari]SMO36548.1 lipid kinase, YegS/Rv2252/BmrU family [Saccharicrinis carchari]